jgi:leucyl-tRNA synthetase
MRIKACFVEQRKPISTYPPLPPFPLQEYTAIKMRLLEPLPPVLVSLRGKSIFALAGTLRPETMCGQTNAWILPDGEYGAFEAKGETF